MIKRFISPLARAVLAALSLVSPLLRAGEAEPSVQVRLELDRDRLLATTEEHAIIKVSLDTTRLAHPENRPPVNLALVIDRSGSMGGEKLSRAKEAALSALSRLAADDLFSLVAYDTTVETIVPSRRVGDGDEIARAIRSLHAEGNTALFGGVSQGASEVRKHLEEGRYSPRVILLSDGLANVGPSSPEELARVGAALMKEGISVTTVGLGLGFNEDLMTRLAQRSDGNTYFVESSADLPRIFAAELGDVLNVVARRVVITLTFPEGIHPRNLLGREGIVKGQTVEFSLNQLYGGQEKFALVEVDVSPSEDGAERKIAEARVTYEDALTQRPMHVKSERSVRFTSQREDVVKSANVTVQADYARNVIAVTKDNAVALVDAHQKKAAAKAMRARADELEILARTYNNTAVLAVAQSSAKEADRIEANGLDNASRKTYRAESVQTKNQQSSASGSYQR